MSSAYTSPWTLRVYDALPGNSSIADRAGKHRRGALVERGLDRFLS